jgi:hypothetical protein
VCFADAQFLRDFVKREERWRGHDVASFAGMTMMGVVVVPLKPKLACIGGGVVVVGRKMMMQLGAGAQCFAFPNRSRPRRNRI